jgi:cell division protein FtsZ
VMGIGVGRGDDRAIQAAERAISSPMLEMSVQGARGVLLSVAGSSEMSLHEVNAAATSIADHCDPDANIIFGATIDDSMGEEMRVTVIAAGFGGTHDRTRIQASATEIDHGAPKPDRPERPPADPVDGDPFDVEIPDFLKG